MELANWWTTAGKQRDSTAIVSMDRSPHRIYVGLLDAGSVLLEIPCNMTYIIVNVRNLCYSTVIYTTD